MKNGTRNIMHRYRRWCSFPTLLSAPFAAALYIDSVYTGINILTSAPERKLLATALPGVEVYVIAVVLAIGGLISMIGTLSDNPRIERGGLGLFTAGTAISGVTILVTTSLSTVNAWLDILLALAALVRFWRLGVGARLRVEAGKRQ